MRHIFFGAAVLAFGFTAAPSAAQAAEAVFVQDGRAVEVEGTARRWRRKDGALEATGTETILLAGRGIGAGDFRVSAELTLVNMDRSAACFVLGDSYFGFEGAHGKMFLTGPLFDDARGLPIADPADFLKEATPFRLDVARRGDRLTFRIDGKLVHQCQVTDKALGRVGLLPWRATMRVVQFRAEGNLDKKLARAPGAEPLTTKKIEGVDKIRLLPPGPNNPRNSEGDFIELKDGRILFVYTHFTGGGGDNAAAHLASRFSRDGGKTWSGEDVLVLENEGDMNIMSVSLLRLQSGEIALFYLVKNSWTDCRPRVRFSRDEAKTWSEPVECVKESEMGYYVMNNDRAVQLASGRILLPVALHNTPEQDHYNGAAVISCYLSDDGGHSWRRSKTAQRGKRMILQEPGVVALKDGRTMMFCRTPHGSQYVAYSGDQGDTWSKFKPSNIISPLSPATIERIPATGDLLLVWNDHAHIAPNLRGKRTPLTVAVSRDEGRTWERVKTLEDDPHGWYCYTAMEFVGDHVLLGHCAGDRRANGLATTQITRFPLAWLYGEPAAEPSR